MSTSNTIRDPGSEPGPLGYHLLVMAPKLCVSHPLVLGRDLIVGRGKDVDVVLADALASRQHARVCWQPEGLTIEDLGSANGIRLREQRVVSGQPVPLLPGEAIGIGKTILMVLQNHAQPSRRVLLSHEDFEGRVEWECARAEACQGEFAVLRFRWAEAGEAGSVPGLESAAAAVLRPVDLLAQYGPGHYEALLPGLAAKAAGAMATALAGNLGSRHIEAPTGIASYPRDGRHAGALIASANARLTPARAGEACASLDGSVSSAMEQLLALAGRAATGTINVLILGETGAGKEVLARWIHEHSARANKAFVCVDCAALSDSLLESELFGHERGAFTGAASTKVGLLETAPGGTVFLDEVGEMPLPLQSKLLRAIENRELTRVGGVRPRPIDVRFLAATNRELEAAAATGAFRRDLYYRLNGMTLTVPPLRGRRDDIPTLARAFVAERCRAEQRRQPSIGKAALDLLCEYAWPGNVRELRNMMERALLLCGTDEIAPAHLPEATLRRSTLSSPSQAEPQTERERIMAALLTCGGNQSRAARLLGISRKVLIARLDAYGATRPRKNPTP